MLSCIVIDHLKQTFWIDPVLAVRFGTMNKLRDFWSNFGEEVFQVLLLTILFLGFFFLITALITAL